MLWWTLFQVPRPSRFGLEPTPGGLPPISDSYVPHGTRRALQPAADSHDIEVGDEALLGQSCTHLFQATGVQFDCRNTLAGLLGSGIATPPPASLLVQAYVDKLVPEAGR